MKNKILDKIKFHGTAAIILPLFLLAACLFPIGGSAMAAKISPLKNTPEFSRVKVITLKEAYLLAAKRNNVIKAAKESYYQSKLLKWSAVGMMLPDAGLKYTDQRLHASSMPVPASDAGLMSGLFMFFYPNFEYSFTLRQPLLNFGVFPAYAAARNSAAAAKMSLYDVSSGTLYEVATGYYGVLNDMSLIKADAKTLNEARSHLELTRAKLKAGLAIITDLLQAESQFYAAKQQLAGSKNLLNSAKAKLAALLGISRNFTVAPPPRPSLENISLKRFIRLAYKSNASLKSLQYEKKAADDEAGYYESQYIPKIDFTASYNGLSGDRFIPDGSVTFWTAAATLTMPIFQGASRIIAIEKARSEADRSMYIAAQGKLDLKARVISEFYDVKTMKYEVGTLRHEEKFALKNYKLVEEEFKAGVATSVDVVTALAELTKARHNLLAAKLRYYESVLGLQKATGFFEPRLVLMAASEAN